MQTLPSLNLIPVGEKKASDQQVPLLCLNCEHPAGTDYDNLYLSLPLKDPNLHGGQLDIADYACSEDINLVFDYFELCRGFNTINICDATKTLELGWCLSLGLEIYKAKPGKSLRDILFEHATSYPNVKPIALWVIELLDFHFQLQGELIYIIEEYLVTGTLVKVGSIYKAPWLNAEPFSN